MSFLPYMRRMRRLLLEDPYIVVHRDAISNSHNLGEVLFHMALSYVVRNRDQCTLLQVGANTGRGKHDLYDDIKQCGIRSVLVEPQPEAFQELARNYSAMPDVYCENAALAHRNGSRTMYRLSEYANLFHAKGRKFGSSIASFDQQHPWDYYLSTCTIEGARQPTEKIVESFDVACITFDELVHRYSFETIDILLVDTEGYDLEVLRLFDFCRFSPCLIKFEHKHLDKHDRRAAWELLRSRGFKLFLVKESGDTVGMRLAVDGMRPTVEEVHEKSRMLRVQA